MKSKTCTGLTLMLAITAGVSGPNFRAYAVQRGDQRLFALNEHADGSVGNARPVDFDVEPRHQQRRIFQRLLTMELSDYTRNPSNIDSTSATTGRMQHTHHIGIVGGSITQNS